SRVPRLLRSKRRASLRYVPQRNAGSERLHCQPVNRKPEAGISCICHGQNPNVFKDYTIECHTGRWTPSRTNGRRQCPVHFGARANRFWSSRIIKTQVSRCLLPCPGSERRDPLQRLPSCFNQRHGDACRRHSDIVARSRTQPKRSATQRNQRYNRHPRRTENLVRVAFFQTIDEIQGTKRRASDLHERGALQVPSANLNHEAPALDSLLLSFLSRRRLEIQNSRMIAIWSSSSSLGLLRPHIPLNHLLGSHLRCS